MEQEQKILVRVFNWEWTSRPMTGSNSIFFPRYLRHPHPAVIRAFFPESAVVAAFSGKIGFAGFAYVKIFYVTNCPPSSTFI
ncbi:MAG: hypothetical protein R2874_02230 [Desulfobacterales bacterium]